MMKLVKEALQLCANEKKVSIVRRFFKTGPGEYAEGDQFIGITVPELRKLAGTFQGLSLKNCERLLNSVIHEERLLALIILMSLFKKSDASCRQQIYRLYLRNVYQINHWDLVDLSAPSIVGATLENKSRSILYTLAKSKHLWKRRIAILSTLYFIRKGDFKDALKISAQLLDDKEDLIHKAAGWMLREIGKRNLAVEEQFLNNHYRRMPRTMLRYAIERFSEAKRRAYLRGRI